MVGQQSEKYYTDHSYLKMPMRTCHFGVFQKPKCMEKPLTNAIFQHIYPLWQSPNMNSYRQMECFWELSMIEITYKSLISYWEGTLNLTKTPVNLATFKLLYKWVLFTFPKSLNKVKS